MRTVLSLERFGFSPHADAGSEPMVLRVVRSPFNVPNASVVDMFNYSAAARPGWETPQASRQRGRQVRDALLKHPGVAGVLQRLAETPVGQKQPLYVMLTRSEAELINWETLCDAQDAFVGLDPRWPIGRITDPMNGQSRPPAELRLPVRMLVVISAFGIQGQGKEWQVLQGAIEAARAAGLPVQLKLMVAEPALRASIDAAIAGGLKDVEVAPVETTGSRMVQAITEWAPQVLHFFCHGRADHDDQSLELARASDHADPAATMGSVRITAAQLVTLSLQLQNPWLLTLNCCSSGQAAEQLQSMAHQVVSAGFPAAVAMLEPVDALDAHEFTRSFYRSLFTSLRDAVNALKAAKHVAFEWSDAMVAARTAICELHDGDPAASHEWALPVLYVRGVEPFHFERAHAESEGDAGDHKARARLVAEWLRTQSQEPEAYRLDVMKRVLAGVPEAFWPKPDGSFALT